MDEYYAKKHTWDIQMDPIRNPEHHQVERKNRCPAVEKSHEVAKVTPRVIIHPV